jgi:hypothetical protein
VGKLSGFVDGTGSASLERDTRPINSDLARIDERWLTLPEHLKAATMALIGTATPSPPGEPKPAE